MHSSSSRSHSDHLAVFLGNLHLNCVQKDFTGADGLFHDLKVQKVALAHDRETKQLLGHGYADFKNQDSLEKALKLNGSMVRGQKVKIVLKKPKAPSTTDKGPRTWGTSKELTWEEFWGKFDRAELLPEGKKKLCHAWNGKFAIDLSFKSTTYDYYVTAVWPKDSSRPKFFTIIPNTKYANDQDPDFANNQDTKDDVERRIRESAVNFHSSVLWKCSPEERDQILARRAHCLRREGKLLEVLRSAWGESFKDDFTVRLTQNFQDHHDLDNACAALLGKTDALKVLCEEHACNKKKPHDAVEELHDAVEELHDAVEELIAVPLSLLHGASSVADAMTAMLRPPQKSELNPLANSLKTSIVERIRLSSLQGPDEELAYDFFNPELIGKAGEGFGILVGHQNDFEKKQWQFCVGGGKRNLGETPLECAIRECNEEFSLSISSPLVLGNESMGDKEWVVVRHEQVTSKHMSCFLMLHKSSSEEMMLAWETAAKDLRKEAKN